MKKIKLFSFLLSLILISATVTIYASDISESVLENNLLGLTDEELSIIDPNNEYYVLKIYECPNTYSFFVNHGINEIVEYRQAYYVLSSKSSNNSYHMVYIENGEKKSYKQELDFYINNEISFINSWESLLQNADITRDIYDQIEVTNIYCIDSLFSPGTTYLYIRTNKGDYMCFQEYTGSENIYMMTIEQYSIVAKQMADKMEDMANSGDYLIGGIYPCDVQDLSAYKVDIKEISDTPPEANDPETSTNSEVTTIVDEQTPENITTQTEEVQNGCSSSLTSIAIIIPAITAAYVIKKKKED